MPGSIIDPEVDGQAFEAGHHLGEHFEESVRVSAHPFHHSVVTVQRIDPAKKIETLSENGGHFLRGFAILSPCIATARVKRELLSVVLKWRWTPCFFS